jgi:hypothetical protein
MSSRKRPVTAETVCDGTRTIGRITPKGEEFEIYNAFGEFLCRASTIAEARAALRYGDIAPQALARLATDGDPTGSPPCT